MEILFLIIIVVLIFLLMSIMASLQRIKEDGQLTLDRLMFLKQQLDFVQNKLHQHSSLLAEQSETLASVVNDSEVSTQATSPTEPISTPAPSPITTAAAPDVALAPVASTASAQPYVAAQAADNTSENLEFELALEAVETTQEKSIEAEIALNPEDEQVLEGISESLIDNADEPVIESELSLEQPVALTEIEIDTHNTVNLEQTPEVLVDLQCEQAPEVLVDLQSEQNSEAELDVAASTVTTEENILALETEADTDSSSAAQLEPIEKLPPQAAKTNVPDPQPSWFQGVVRWLVDGNPFAKVGVLLLFLGLGYLVRFSAEHGLIPVEYRFAFAGVISVVLLVIGWRLRLSKPLYGTILQGGGVGGLYLTIVAASVLFQLLPLQVSLILLIVISACAVVLALLQNAFSLALLAVIGGYLAPLLVSTGSNNYIGLFSYNLIISTMVLCIGYFKAWRGLNLVAFTFSVAVAGLWGWKYYQPEFYLASQIFLVLNLLLFAFLSQLYVLRNQVKASRVELILAIGVPVIGFVLQYLLVRDNDLLAGASALAFAALYLIFVGLVLRRDKQLYNELILINGLLCLSFIILSVPLSLSAKATSVIWAVAGTLVLGYGHRVQQKSILNFAYILHLLAALAVFYTQFAYGEVGANEFTVIYLVVGVSVLLSAGLSYKSRVFYAQSETISYALLVVSIFWLLSAIYWLSMALDISYRAEVYILAFSILCMMYQMLGQRFAWLTAERVSWAIIPVFTLYILHYAFLKQGLISHWQHTWVVCVPLLFMGYLAKRNTAHFIFFAGVTLWQFILMLLFEVRAAEHILQQEGLIDWISFIWSVSLSAVVLLVVFSRKLLKLDQSSYVKFLHLLMPLWLILPLMLLMFNTYSGFSSISLYIPLLNPLEIGLWAIWISLLALIVHYPNNPMRQESLLFIWAAAFYIVNGSIMRVVAAYYDIPWIFHHLWQSFAVQTALSVFWAAVAFVLVILAQRLKNRQIWRLGAVLLAVVTVKLLLKDAWVLDSGLYRAGSFIFVALIFIVLGYFAPQPPVLEEASKSTEQDA